MAGTRVPAPPPPPETVLRGHSSGVQGICFLNKETVLSGDANGFIKVWNLERRRVCAEFYAHPPGSAVLRLERFDDTRIVSQGRDGVIKVWDAEELAAGQAGKTASRSASLQTTSTSSPPEPIRSIICGSYTFCPFALTRWRDVTTTVESSGMRHASGKAGDAVSDGEERPGKGRRRRQKCSSNSSADDPGRGEHKDRGQREDDPALEGFERRRHAQGKASGEDGLRGEEEEEDGGERGASVAQGAESSTSGSFAANALLAPCSEHHTVALWDIRAKTRAYDIAPADPTRTDMVMCTRLLGESPSSASPLAVCGHDHGSLCVYDLRATSAEPLITLRLHKEPVLCVDVGSSGKQGVSGSADNNIHVFKLDAQKGLCEVKKTFHLEHPGTSCVEIRQDQKLFVSGGWDHRVRVFSWAKAPRPLAVLRSHDETVFNVAYSPRIGVFASGSKDCRVAVWDLFPDHRK